MGISAVASYIGGTLIDTVDLAPDVIARCFPNAAAWPGRTTLADLGARASAARDAALALPPTPAGREPRLPDPGWARFRADGEAHLFSPGIAKEIQVLSGLARAATPRVASVDAALERYRGALRRDADDARPCRATSSGSRRSPTPAAARRRRGRARDRPPVRRVGDERRAP